jgi:uncharacterized protein YndB with AHSA1/START domain
MAGKNETLVVTHVYPYPPERVFDAWLDPAAAGNWLFSTPKGEMKKVHIDPRVGGKFQVFEQRGQELAEHHGTYLEIDRPRRLAFKFHTSHSSDPTLVTIDIAPFGAGCKLTLTHQLDPKWASFQELARKGWTGILDNLDSTLSPDPDFVLTRVFDAPRELVYQMWIDPKHLAAWWGPRIMRTPVCDMNVRVGGKFRIVMCAPDSTDYPITGAFQEISAPGRLVLTMDCSEHPAAWHDMVKPNRKKTEDNPAGIMLTTVTFEETKGKTTMTMRMKLATTEVAASMKKMGMREGWSESLDRLAEQLAPPDANQKTTLSRTNERTQLFTRVFDAPRDLVFEVWTNPKHVVNWWGPNGFTTTSKEMDVRTGGTWRLVMRGPDGRDYHNRIVYVEVVKPERLVYRHVPEPGDEPINFQTTTTFEDLGNGKTRVTMRQEFESFAKLQYVIEKYSADKGGVQTFERLAGYLVEIKR